MVMGPMTWVILFLALNFAPLKPICAANQEKCSYVVEVKTEKSLKSYIIKTHGIKDPVHVRFRDKNGIEVFKKHLNEGEEEKRFKPGKTDNFSIQGDCLKDVVCLLNFMVEGEDDWTPETANIYKTSLVEPDSFNFGRKLPARAWHGPNYCNLPQDLGSSQSIKYTNGVGKDQGRPSSRKPKHTSKKFSNF
ncbi:hypothetical protein SUGI_1137570 [Cryptomeria japonica]|uniref:embryo-specific protein ATS3 n=1 Tax=Cryptomeria japonica TaxID=3369 RepID=UPI0024147370|nr:embryo-specific protein ATS3 [Cryptomeria japonica]XP_057842374.1 embryo-specific protein ATS3 [Cryptomeria japonica]GLJ53352.1 hypothetical protein SUGI_1137570 [Cryptomeria japonica]